jgi:hypothetical protein
MTRARKIALSAALVGVLGLTTTACFEDREQR